MEDVVCRSPSAKSFWDELLPVDQGNRQNQKLSSKPTQYQEADGQELASEVFNLLGPNIQSYNDPSIIKWYKSREVSPERNHPSTHTTTLCSSPSASGVSSDSSVADSDRLEHTVRSPRVEESRRIPVRVVSVQSLLSSCTADDLTSHSPKSNRVGQGNIEDAILDGLRWLSSCAP